MSVFIIAEAGVNHNGSVELAYQLVDAAAKAGADAIKFQTFKAEKLVLKSAHKADYQKQDSGESESQLEMLKKLELNGDAYREIQRYCQQKDIIFLSTPFDMESVDILCDLGLEIFKIPSGEITNLPYLRYIGRLQKQVILSTGMSTLDEIGDALLILTTAGTSMDNITVLHANTMYPTPMGDVNLNAMLAIKNHFGVAVGYSDHTLGIEVDIAAVAMGASVIEKHFTLDKSMSGPDHGSSLEPGELTSMVLSIRNIEKAMGNGEKTPSPSERVNIHPVRKSIVASRAIEKGEIFSSDNLTTKRPGNGMSPMKWDQVIGSEATRNYQSDEQI